MSSSPSSNGTKKDPPFLHLKFTSGRPPLHGHHLPFAHELGPDHVADLPDSLKTDVQRKGITRWVEQNFKEGAYIWEVVHERKERDGMYGLVTKNWARSVGDPKLHLSIHVYQEDMHVATWHAYSDRSVSYSRAGDENDPPPTPPTGSDPYSTPEALAVSRSATPAVQLDDDDRPRFDRPAAAPDSEDDEALEEEAPFKPEEVVKEQVVREKVASRSARRSLRAESSERAESEDEDEPDERQRRKTERPKSHSSAESRSPSPERPAPTRTSSRAARKPKPATPPPASPTRSDPSSPERSPPPERKQIDLSKRAYPIVKSKPLGKVSSRNESTSSSPSRSRERIPPVRRTEETATQSDGSEHDEPVRRSTRDRSRRRPRSPEEAPSSPRHLRLRSRSHSPSPSRSPSPRPGIEKISAEKHYRSKPGHETAGTEGDHSTRVEKRHHRNRSRRRRRSRSPSSSRSPSPVADKKISPSKHHKDKRSERKARPVDEGRSRSASPTRGTVNPTRDGVATTQEVQDERGRRSKRRDEPADAPTWRSVSRTRHRGDSSDNDTLVRGNLDDAGLDIPAGGEATLLKAKRRSSISEARPRRPRRDESFDPEVVQQPPPEPVKQTATAVLGNWIKSVGTLLKQDVPSGDAVEGNGSDGEEEERRRRKAERAKRRAARAARRAAREAEESTRELVRHRSRRHESSDEAERPRHHHCSPPERPPVRERAMSVSATLDSGIRSLRESVVKMVSGSAVEESASARDRPRRHSESEAVVETDDSEETRRKRRAKRASSRRRANEEQAIEDRATDTQVAETRASSRPHDRQVGREEAVRPAAESPTLDEPPRRRANRRPLRAPSSGPTVEAKHSSRHDRLTPLASLESDSSERADPVLVKPPKLLARDAESLASPAPPSTRSTRQHTPSYKLADADGPGRTRSALPSRSPVFEAAREPDRMRQHREEPAPPRRVVAAVTPDSPSESAPPKLPLPRPDVPATSHPRASPESRQPRPRRVVAASASDSDGDWDRFEAAPARAPVRQTRREDSIPPIPAPRYPTVSPPYDAGVPHRPEPVRPKPTPVVPIEDRRRSLHATYSDSEPDRARYDRSAGPSPSSTRHLPRSQSFSRSQPDFYPSSGIDDDSSSFESESERSGSRSCRGASTSEADSLAFAPASSRGPSRVEHSSRPEAVSEAGPPYDRFSLSSGIAPMDGRQSRTTVGPPQPSRESLPRESPHFDDFGPEPKRGSRTMVSSRPLHNPTSTSAWRTDDELAFSARREPTHNDRRFDAMSSSSSDSPRLRSFAIHQQEHDYSHVSRDRHSDRPMPDSPDRDPQRAFDSMLRKGIESGSVKRFGKHGAPVSRRTAMRLGLQ